MTSDRIAEIRARAGAATPGPWGTEYDGKGTYHVHARLRTTPSEGMASDGVVASLTGRHGDSQVYRDARFVAHAREDIPFLLDRVAKLERLQADETGSEPTMLRWGLDDVLYGDDDTITVLLSGPDGRPYWLELDPERAAALRDSLAGSDTEETHVVADDSDDPEHVDDCPGCEPQQSEGAA